MVWSFCPVTSMGLCSYPFISTFSLFLTNSFLDAGAWTGATCCLKVFPYSLSSQKLVEKSFHRFLGVLRDNVKLLLSTAFFSHHCFVHFIFLWWLSILLITLFLILICCLNYMTYFCSVKNKLSKGCLIIEIMPKYLCSRELHSF